MEPGRKIRRSKESNYCQYIELGPALEMSRCKRRADSRFQIDGYPYCNTHLQEMRYAYEREDDL